MKNFIALAACTAAMIVSSACSKTTTERTTTTVNNGNPSTAPAGTEVKNSDKALVRFINATTTTADLYFGDMKVFSSVPPGAATPYMELPAERHDFKLYVNGKDAGEPAASNSEGPSAGKHYTVLAAVKDDGKPVLNPITDELDKPAPGRAKIRVINASPEAGDIDVYPKGSEKAWVSGVGFNHATDYKEVDPTIAELDIRRGGSKKDEVKLTDLNVKPDKFYTVVVMGTRGQPIRATIIEDQLMPPRG